MEARADVPPGGAAFHAWGDVGPMCLKLLILKSLYIQT